MKKKISILTAALMAFLFLGCSYGKIVVKNDDFKNAKVVNMKLKHKSKETYFLMSYRTDVNYVREVTKEGKKPINLNVTLFGVPVNKGELEMKAILRVDAANFELPLGNVTGKIITKVSQDVDYSKKSETSISTSSSKEYSAKIVTTPEISAAIENCNSFAFRLYLGTDPLTFIVKPDKLKKIKAMMAVN